jgi:hypothetical protein
MGLRTVVGAAAVAAALVVTAAPADAGAPNYDCVVGGDGHLSIDQYVDVVAARGLVPGPAVWGVASKVHQAGPSLELVATFGRASWQVAIRGGGASLALTQLAGTLTGTCIFIPGNEALRSSDGGGFALRAGPSGRAQRLMRIPVGTAVWERPDPARRGRWLPVHVFVPSGGSLTVSAGWLRQRKPSVLRG